MLPEYSDSLIDCSVQKSDQNTIISIRKDSQTLSEGQDMVA